MLIALNRCFHKCMKLTPCIVMMFWLVLGSRAPALVRPISGEMGIFNPVTVLLLVVSGTFLFPVWGVDGGGISAAASTVTLCYLLCVCMCRL